MIKFTINRELSNFLNFLRWFSAFFVVIGHLRSILFENIDKANISNFLGKFFYFITGFGHQAVIIFFVISGFLVSSSMVKRFNKNELSIKEYLIIDRGIRIYLVLIPALILTFILDFIGISFFNYSGIYTGVIDFSSLNYSILNRLNFDIFIGNMLMLQNSFYPTFGSNSPLWSLAYEVWYYILFFIFLSFFNTTKFLLKIFYIFIFFAIIYLLNIDIILYFSIWLLGFLPWLYNKNISNIITFIILSLFLVVLIISRLHLVEKVFYIDFLFALIIIGLITIVKNNKIIIFNFYSSIHKYLSDFSYTLYLLHFPIIILLVSILSTYFNCFFSQKLSILNFLLFIIFIIVIYLISFIFAKFTEYKTKIIQKKLKGVFK